MKGGHESSGDHANVSGKKRVPATSPEDQPGPKRSRVSRACDQCRASRERCDGTQPTCQTCTSQLRECSYIEQPKKRGIQPNYIRTLEMLLAWLFEAYKPSEATLAVKLASSNDAAQKILAGKDAPGAEVLHQAWRNSIVCRQIEQMLSGSAVEPPESSMGVVARDASLQLSQSVPAASREQMVKSPHGPPGLDYQLKTGASSFALPDLVTRHKLPTNAWTLLEYHFAFTLAWLPITDKQEMLKLMYAFPAEGLTELELAQSGAYVELLSIMALAAWQTGARTEAERLRHLALSLMPSVQKHCNACHAKAQLILCVFELTDNQWLAAWMLVGIAIRSLLAMMNNDSQAEGTPSIAYSAGQAGNLSSHQATSTGASLNRAILAAFVLESTIAARMSLTPHLRPSMVGTSGAIHEDGLEEWGPWSDPLAQSTSVKAPARAFSTLNALVRMAIACYDSNGQVASHEASIDHSTSFFQPVANEQHQPLASSPTGIGWTVSTLIQNAAYSTGRRHPQEVLAACEAGTTLAGVSPPISGNSTVQQPQGFAYMSVPTNHSTETAVESPSLDAIAGTAAAPWPHGSAQMPGQLPDFASVDNAAHSLDLFEELAMLERTDSSQHPQFLQNLGFLPDLDLAEFFGADYQPSDPHLAYMQPSVFSNMPSSTGDGGADIG